ncbi:MAG TPA: hypothetical protein VIL46_05350 [Gemmataceae bacterium]
MSSRGLLGPILRDEAITRGLGDPEARLLIEWLVDWAELLAETMPTEEEARGQVERLCRRARAIAHFVRLWGDPRSRGAAVQLAAAERLGWPLPAGDVDPVELMRQIVSCEKPPPGRAAA